MIGNLTNKDDLTEIMKSDKFSLIEFWSFRVDKCRHMATIISRWASENENKCNVFKVNVDDAPEVTSIFKVYAIPTLILYKNGKMIQSFDESVQEKDISVAITER